MCLLPWLHVSVCRPQCVLYIHVWVDLRVSVTDTDLFELNLSWSVIEVFYIGWRAIPLRYHQQ